MKGGAECRREGEKEGGREGGGGGSNEIGTNWIILMDSPGFFEGSSEDPLGILWDSLGFFNTLTCVDNGVKWGEGWLHNFKLKSCCYKKRGRSRG